MARGVHAAAAAVDWMTRPKIRGFRAKSPVSNQRDSKCNSPIYRLGLYYSSIALYIRLHTIMASTLRSLRPLARYALPTIRAARPSRAATMPLLARGYKSEPARDMMTGEVIQLPDIDVSPSSACLCGLECGDLDADTVIAHDRDCRGPAESQEATSPFQTHLWTNIHRSHVDHSLEQQYWLGYARDQAL